MYRAVATAASAWARCSRAAHSPSSAGNGALQRRLLTTALPLAMLLPIAGSLASQAAPRTVSGVVQDSAGRPLPDAVVVLDPNDQRRATEADAQGRFRFEKVKPGEHQLRTVWIGYQPDDRTIDVPDSGMVVRIVLAALTARLDTIRVIARRGGLIGTTVVSKSLRALGGADVDVLGTRFRARTKADGRFVFPALRPGGYVVKASRSGFKSVFISVAVRRGDASEVSMALDSLIGKSDALRENLFRDMRMRVDKRSTNNSVIVPSIELRSRGAASLDVALMFTPSFLVKGLKITGQECVFVNGKYARAQSLKNFSADEVSMVEVYGSGQEDGGRAALEEFVAQYGPPDCGYWAVVNTYMVKEGAPWHDVQPARPGLVHLAYIWLKGN